MAVQQQPVAPRFPVPARLADDDGDDGRVYIFDRGRLVLGEWRAGVVVPARQLPRDWQTEQLVARGWKLKAHGQGMCHVIRLMVGGWDVADWIDECHGRATDDHPGLCVYCFSELRTPYEPLNRRW